MGERMKASFIGVVTVIGLMLVGSLVIAIIVNFSTLSSSAFQWISFITSVLVLMVGGFIGGKKTEEKGWLTGAVVGIIYVIGIILYQFLAQDAWMYQNQFLYFLIFVLAAVVGGMFGVNIKKS
ncbi:TIGR04086 family membrane protein [Piscibacillus halophilus]|uniref:Putative membrane protein, TIGR04086 family n=1 Tax=Piscibacillus halophilus TaxID=571933 RepID=A0A1H9BWE8_9BACI|nr:TIGR04086 family membrane protein [Piscibacillus halophilus]SEP92883.1 putative membrane protein, TIGR04086 family [Piscibacillus halophilus]